jgi:succinate dehydrogenase / fumarate reductase membrane anchor subunit
MSVRPAAWERPALVTPARAPERRVVDYVVLRVTGLVLSVLVLGHFAVTHFVTDVANDNSTFVARRLSSALWIVWDSAMLAAALAHGAAGVRMAIADYAVARRRRLEVALFAGTAVLFVLGVVAIVRVVAQ